MKQNKIILAMVYAVKRFRFYLFYRLFNIVITNHKSLPYLMYLKEANSKLVRWRLKLEEYNYQNCYKNKRSDLF